MLIPWRVVAVKTWTGNLDEPHAGLDQSPSSQRLAGVVSLMLDVRIGAIKLVDVLGLFGDIR